MFWREGRKDGQTSGFWRAAITAIECDLFAATTISITIIHPAAASPSRIKTTTMAAVGN